MCGSAFFHYGAEPVSSKHLKAVPQCSDNHDQEVPIPELPPGPWSEHLTVPAPSGCDSSNCTYCQTIVRRRGIDGANSVCWLRRKRSENELASMGGTPDQPSAANSASSPGSATNTSHSATPTTIWDHALLEPQDAAHAVDRILSSYSHPFSSSSSQLYAATSPTLVVSNNSTVGQPWGWKDSFLARPDPVPSRFVELAAFTGQEMPANAHQAAAAAAASSQRSSADIVCGMEFEEHGWLLATAGVSKQVRVYSLSSFFASSDASSPSGTLSHPLHVHRLSSKLSSLAWNPDAPGVVTVGDYDGTLSQLDLDSGHLLTEADEHSGRRVWSLSHSHLRPHLAASGSEDGSVALWEGPALAKLAARVHLNAPVTGVHLSPFDENALAVACADACAYVFDLRQLSAPVAALRGHSRPASYVKYLDRSNLVTAAVDASLAAWDLTAAVSSTNDTPMAPVKRFRGHANSKNFVGLAVRPEDRLVACGSETSKVYAYSMAWDTPMVAHNLQPTAQQAQQQQQKSSFFSSSVFCSAVAWQPSGAAPQCGPLLAAAMSDGGVRVLGLRQSDEQ